MNISKAFKNRLENCCECKKKEQLSFESVDYTSFNGGKGYVVVCDVCQIEGSEPRRLKRDAVEQWNYDMNL